MVAILSWPQCVNMLDMWHDYSKSMMTSSNENIFRDTGHLYREFTGDLWIPRTKTSDAELRCFCAPEQTVE